ncbi:MAG: ROK family protein [Christensenellales bacterium]|jgi:fructokinase
MRLGALEAGGTKMVCSVGDENGTLFARVSIPTEHPGVTLPKIAAFFRDKGIEALGIGSFGPLDLNPKSPAYGHITTTPKPGWKDAPLLPYLRDALAVPCGIDTDVNAAALAEWKLGAGRGLNNLIYVTVGTGVGAGAVVEGNLVHGLMHPEAGHIVIRPHRNDPSPVGFCPYHVSCLEGLAAGPTFDKRWGKSAKELPHDHIGWDIEAYYLAQFCVNAFTLLSAECIVLGGGVMQQEFLFEKIRKQTLSMLNGYIASDRLLNHIDTLIVPPGLSIHSGVTGALLLAADALKK